MPPRDLTLTPALDPVEAVTRRQLLTAIPAFALLAAGGSCGDDDDDDDAELGARQSFTDALGRTVNVPVNPKRIVALHDASYGQALLSIGAPLIGVTTDDGKDISPALRDRFDWSGVASVGTYAELDVEAIVRLRPDLIIGDAFEGKINAGADLEALQRVAPTVGLSGSLPVAESMRILGQLSGFSAEVEKQRTEYERELDGLRDDLGDSAKDLTVVLVGSFEAGAAYLFPDNHASPYVQIPLAVGVQLPTIVRNRDNYVSLSGERLRDIQSDVILYNVKDTGDPTGLALWSQLPAVRAGQAHAVPNPYGYSYVDFREAIPVLRSVLVGADASIAN